VELAVYDARWGEQEMHRSFRAVMGVPGGTSTRLEWVDQCAQSDMAPNWILREEEPEEELEPQRTRWMGTTELTLTYKEREQHTTVNGEVTEAEVERCARALFPWLKQRRIRIEEEESTRRKALGNEKSRRFVVTSQEEADLRGLEIMVGVGDCPTRKMPADQRWTTRDLVIQTREWIVVPKE
jgi:hypothetical protein